MALTGSGPQSNQMIEASQPKQMTVTERLRARRDHLRTQLHDVDMALNALETNPQTAAVVDAISKLGHF